MSRGSLEEHHLNELGDDVVQYRAVSGLAVAGLIFGGASVLALLHPAWWILPVLGVVVSGLALIRIRMEASALIGRKAAVAGLVLAVLFGAAAPAQLLTYRWLIDREARRFAAAWFELLVEDEPHKAYELTKSPGDRKPLDDRLWQLYPEDSESRMEIESFVRRPGVRALLALGPDAQIRYYDTEKRGRDDNGDFVRQVYAVTYEEAGAKKTFFMSLLLERSRIPKVRIAVWRIGDIREGVQPIALGGE